MEESERRMKSEEWRMKIKMKMKMKMKIKTKMKMKMKMKTKSGGDVENVNGNPSVPAAAKIENDNGNASVPAATRKHGSCFCLLLVVGCWLLVVMYRRLSPPLRLSPRRGLRGKPLAP